jgi:hypothetical protein
VIIAPTYSVGSSIAADFSQSQVGHTLVCYPGSWQSPTSPLSVTVEWYSGATVVTTGEIYTLTAANAATGYGDIPGCRVRATNDAGTTTITMPAPRRVVVSLPRPPTVAFAPTGASSVLRRVDSAGRVLILLSCTPRTWAPGPCVGSLEITRGGVGPARIGFQRFRIGAAGRTVVAVQLSSHTLQQLRRSVALDVEVTLSAELFGDYAPVPVVLDGRALAGVAG